LRTPIAESDSARFVARVVLPSFSMADVTTKTFAALSFAARWTARRTARIASGEPSDVGSSMGVAHEHRLQLRAQQAAGSGRVALEFLPPRLVIRASSRSRSWATVAMPGRPENGLGLIQRLHALIQKVDGKREHAAKTKTDSAAKPDDQHGFRKRRAYRNVRLSSPHASPAFPGFLRGWSP